MILYIFLKASLIKFQINHKFLSQMLIRLRLKITNRPGGAGAREGIPPNSIGLTMWR